MFLRRIRPATIAVIVSALPALHCVAVSAGDVDQPGPNLPHPAVDSWSPTAHSRGHGVHRHARRTTVAVIGDVPYGDDAMARFGTLIDGINADPAIRIAVHVGDTKSGKTLCSDTWNEAVYRQFMTFRDPLVYTPGDNEWADCHRTNNGGYDPLERLDTVRKRFFDEPGEALGRRPMRLATQRHYPENQRWSDAGVTFATVHVVGSNNGLVAWTGHLETETNRQRRESEWAQRNHANIQWLRSTFAAATRHRSAGIALFFHGDLYNPSDRADGTVTFDGHQSFVEEISTLAIAFDRPVVIISGDSHDFRVDAPADWISTYYAVETPALLTQIIVDRSIDDSLVWLRLMIDRHDPLVFSWKEVRVVEP